MFHGDALVAYCDYAEGRMEISPTDQFYSVKQMGPQKSVCVARGVLTLPNRLSKVLDQARLLETTRRLGKYCIVEETREEGFWLGTEWIESRCHSITEGDLEALVPDDLTHRLVLIYGALTLKKIDFTEPITIEHIRHLRSEKRRLHREWLRFYEEMHGHTDFGDLEGF